jgi:sec-independent protein translocase protein TatA
VVGDLLQPTHLLFVLAVALLVLGPKRLPEVGRALGKGLRDFRSAMSGEELPERTTPAPEPPSSSAQPTPAPTATVAAEPVSADTAPIEVQTPRDTAEPVASSSRADSGT